MTNMASKATATDRKAANAMTAQQIADRVAAAEGTRIARSRTNITERYQRIANTILAKITTHGAMEAASLFTSVVAYVEQIPSPEAKTTNPRQSRTVTEDPKEVNTVFGVLLRAGQLRKVRTNTQQQHYPDTKWMVNGATTHTYRKHLRNWSISRLDLNLTADVKRHDAAREVTLIADADITKAELVAAVKLYRATQPRKIRNAARPLTQWDLDADRMAGSHADDEDGCLAIQSVTDPLTAEETAWETAETQRLYNLDAQVGRYADPAHKPLSQLAQERIAYQDRIGQPARNTKRAEARRKQDFLNTTEGQIWLDAKREEDDAIMASALAQPTIDTTTPLPEDDDDVFSVAFTTYTKEELRNGLGDAADDLTPAERENYLAQMEADYDAQLEARFAAYLAKN